MAIVDNRLNKTLIAFNMPAADFAVNRADSMIVNLDATVGDGILIHGFEGIFDVNVADIPNILVLYVMIFRNSNFTTGFIFGATPVEDYELVYLATSEDPQDRLVTRDFSASILLDRGSYYSVVFVPSATALANNFNMWFTVRGNYVTKDQPSFYGKSR